MLTIAVPPFSSVTITLEPLVVTTRASPLTVVSVARPLPAITRWTSAAASSLPDTTWAVRILVSVALFSGLSKVATVPAGSASNAALVGAKTVKGPGVFKVSTRPAALTAATNVVWSFELTALSMMSLLGSMAAPPTMTDGPPDIWLLVMPLLDMPPAQALSKTATLAAISSFFMKVSS